MLALGEKPLSIPLLECSPVSVFCCVTFHLLCGLTKYTIVATAMLAVGLGVSQALFSPGHWHPSTDVRSKDCSSNVPVPVMGAMEAAQTPTCTNHHMYVPTKSTAANIWPISAMGALVVHSDVSPVLNLQSQLQ